MSEYLDEFDLTIATLWTEERISCPHQDLLAAYADGGQPAGQGEYLRFHLEEVACPHCRSILSELGSDPQLAAEPDPDESEVIAERLLRSTRTILRESKGEA